VTGVEERDVEGTTAALANIISGRICNWLIEAGMRTQMRLPTTWTGVTADGFSASAAATLTFSQALRRTRTTVTLSGPPAALAASTSADAATSRSVDRSASTRAMPSSPSGP